MADPVLLLALVLQKLKSHRWENRKGENTPKFKELESRQTSANQFCRYEKLNPKAVVRKAENQPNLYHRNLRILRISSTNYLCKWKWGGELTGKTVGNYMKSLPPHFLWLSKQI